jgi:type VI secretion system protein ImpB
MPESIQHKLDRVRRPRVQITYDVETLGSIVKTELPFVVGIMADLSGNGLERADTDRKNKALPMKDRKYVEIDRDSFDVIMDKIKPQVKLADFPDSLEFKSLEDFSPMHVLRQLPTLYAKFQSRIRLSNLLAKLDGNPQLQEDLIEAIKSLKPEEKEALDKYAKSYLLADGQAGSVKEPDLTKLTEEDDQSELKVYIVKNFPETMTPGLIELANNLNDADKKKLVTYVVKKYPFSYLAKLSDADKMALIDFIVTLNDPSAPSKPADATAPPPDPTPMVEALSDDNKKKVQEFVVPKLITAVTTPAPDLTLLDKLGPYEKDEVKSYAVASLKSAKVAPVGEGGIDQLGALVDALSADDRQQFMKYVASKYPVTVKGDQS